MKSFKQYNRTIPIQNTSKAVESVEVSVKVDNAEAGELNITDFMLQGGSIGTVWVYHPSEIRWSHDG